MQLVFLKKIRVVVSLIFFIFTIFIFVDFTGLVATRLIQAILYLQFIPSFLKFINAFSIAAAGFLFMLHFNDVLWKGLLFNSLSLGYLAGYLHLGYLKNSGLLSG